MPKKLLIPALFLLSFRLFAWNADNTAPLQENRTYGFSLSPVTAVVGGYANELVYGSDSGDYPYLSRLIWQIKPAYILGVEGAFNYEDRFFFNIALGKALNTETGLMTDHDWDSDYFDDVNTEWTHESVSSITLNKSFFLDANGAWRFYRRKNYTFDLKAGFKLIRWGWTDMTLSYDYPYAVEDFTGMNGIDYVVQYNIPYIGIRAQAVQGPVTGGISLGWSFLAFGSDYDYHKLKNRKYYDSFTMGQYLGLSSYIRIRLYKSFTASLAWDFDWIPEVSGNIAVYTADNYYMGTSYGSAGFEYMASSLSLSFSYSF
ncbi:MAG: omptin family outer membrane protease [Spirochaetales bacterium]|nr:omptin family outer membrane protease [Spirochaetales bacterium]